MTTSSLGGHSTRSKEPPSISSDREDEVNRKDETVNQDDVSESNGWSSDEYEFIHHEELNSKGKRQELPTQDFPNTWEKAYNDTAQAIDRLGKASSKYLSSIANSGIVEAGFSVGGALASTSNRTALETVSFAMNALGKRLSDLPPKTRKWYEQKALMDQAKERAKQAEQDRQRRKIKQELLESGEVTLVRHGEPGSLTPFLSEMSSPDSLSGFPMERWARENRARGMAPRRNASGPFRPGFAKAKAEAEAEAEAEKANDISERTPGNSSSVGSTIVRSVCSNTTEATDQVLQTILSAKFEPQTLITPRPIELQTTPKVFSGKIITDSRTIDSEDLHSIVTDSAQQDISRTDEPEDGVESGFNVSPHPARRASSPVKLDDLYTEVLNSYKAGDSPSHSISTKTSIIQKDQDFATDVVTSKESVTPSYLAPTSRTAATLTCSPIAPRSANIEIPYIQKSDNPAVTSSSCTVDVLAPTPIAPLQAVDKNTDIVSINAGPYNFEDVACARRGAAVLTDDEHDNTSIMSDHVSSGSTCDAIETSNGQSVQSENKDAAQGMHYEPTSGQDYLSNAETIVPRDPSLSGPHAQSEGFGDDVDGFDREKHGATEADRVSASFPSNSGYFGMLSDLEDVEI